MEIRPILQGAYAEFTCCLPAATRSEQRRGGTESIWKLCFALEMAWFPKRQLILCAEQSLKINLPVSVLLVVSVMPSQMR